jgi:hypothetical protein
VPAVANSSAIARPDALLPPRYQNHLASGLHDQIR